MFAGAMSRCITPRRCIPATARANPTASPISSSTASGFASPPRLVPPTSATTSDPGYRGASSSCATPATPRSRSSIASSCRSRRSPSGPSGSLRMTVRPAKRSRVTRERSLSLTSTAPADGSRSASNPRAPIRHTHAAPSGGPPGARELPELLVHALKPAPARPAHRCRTGALAQTGRTTISANTTARTAPHHTGDNSPHDAILRPSQPPTPAP